MIQAVIFNWDSMIADCRGQKLLQGIMDIFRWKGIEITARQAETGRGLPIREHIAVILRLADVRARWHEAFGHEPGRPDIEQMYVELLPVLVSLLPSSGEPFPGMDRALAELQERSIQCGSTTAFPSDMLRRLRGPAESRHRLVLDSLVSPCEVQNNGRPYPWMMYENARRLHVYPLTDILKIGDTAADMQEGRNAGVWTVGLVNRQAEAGLSAESDSIPHEESRHHSAQLLRKAGAHMVIDTLSELPWVLREIEMLQHTGGFPMQAGMIRS
ncbi:HAD hydrolase-like protein [Paenibacillus sp. JX-17]|uniref:Phosphonoacetaldehyde hydrolase n=1 Tax=Paenibacillus lacisoli TaxID=3064525 RepID=A0ABT9CDJ4_9BACL|nr:HAD family hydrolase [Paenibacillus sp. JX-17]MDO7906714.1 HAD hydrolase-like protein [Paenibacillus sp. JX-17]